MSTNTEKLSCKKYLCQNSEHFSLVAFYEYFNFETRQIAENALRGTVYALEKTPKRNKKRVNDLLKLINSNDFEYLKNSAVEAFWSKVDARNAQVKRIYKQTKLQALIENTLLEDLKASESVAAEEGPAIKKRRYVLDISELEAQASVEPKRLGKKT